MWLMRRLTALSLSAIGREFGGRDHTTVQRAFHRVEQRMAADAAVAETVQRLERELAAWPGRFSIRLG